MTVWIVEQGMSPPVGIGPTRISVFASREAAEDYVRLRIEDSNDPVLWKVTEYAVQSDGTACATAELALLGR